MGDLQTILVATVVVLPLAAAVVRCVGARFGVPGWFTLIGCGGAASAAVGGLLAARFGNSAEVTALGGVTWLDVEGATVVLGLRVDPFALGWAASVLTAAALLLVAGRECGPTSEFLVVLAATAVVGFGAAFNLVFALVCGGVASLAAFLLVGIRDERGASGMLARRVLLFHLIGDGLLLLAALYAMQRVGSDGVLELSGGISQLGAYLSGSGLHAEELTRDEFADRIQARFAVTSLIGFALLGCLVGRSAMFPLFGSAHDVGKLPSPAAGVGLAIVLPATSLLLVRCAGVFKASGDAASVVGVLGGLTALLAGWSACGQRERGPTLGLAIAAMLGVAVTGMVHGGESKVAGATLLLAIPVCAAGMTCGLTDDRWSITGRRSAIVGAGVLIVGVFGANVVVENRLAVGDVTAAVLLLSGSAATAFALARTCLRSDEPEDETTLVVPRPEPRSIASLVPIVLVIAFATGAWFVFDGWMLHRSLTMPIAEKMASLPLSVGLVTLVALPAAVGGWMMRNVDLVPRLGALGRLAEHRFYIPDLIALGFVLPLRGLAQIARFVDWFLLDGLVAGFPRFLLSRVDSSTEPLRGAIVPVSVLSVVLALAGLLASFLWR